MQAKKLLDPYAMINKTSFRHSDNSVNWKTIFLTYVVGTQKNSLNETVSFEHPKDMFILMGKKLIAILRS